MRSAGGLRRYRGRLGREDTTGFVKVLADPETGLLLGAHIIGPEAATVIQPLIQAMSFGLRAHDVARGQYWIHPALSEVVENALLALPKPTGKGWVRRRHRAQASPTHDLSAAVTPGRPDNLGPSRCQFPGGLKLGIWPKRWSNCRSPWPRWGPR